MARARRPIFWWPRKKLGDLDLPHKSQEECVPRYRPILRLMNPFLALVLYNSMVLSQFLATNPKYGRNTKQDGSKNMT